MASGPLNDDQRDALQWSLYNKRHWAASGERSLARIRKESILTGDRATLELLLRYGVCDKRTLNTTAVDDMMNVALHTAARDDHVSLVGLLLSVGCDVSPTNEVNETPLHLAQCNGRVQRMLIDAGADVHAMDDFGQGALAHCGG